MAARRSAKRASQQLRARLGQSISSKWASARDRLGFPTSQGLGSNREEAEASRPSSRLGLRPPAHHFFILLVTAVLGRKRGHELRLLRGGEVCTDREGCNCSGSLQVAATVVTVNLSKLLKLSSSQFPLL